ncbi:MAG: hypothetical protein DRP71_14040, partial [Verrucomicrobia bacterium]
NLFPFIHVGFFDADMAFWFDPLSATMCLIITFIGRPELQRRFFPAPEDGRSSRRNPDIHERFFPSSMPNFSESSRRRRRLSIQYSRIRRGERLLQRNSKARRSMEGQL